MLHRHRRQPHRPALHPDPLATSYLHFKQPATVRSHTQSHPPYPQATNLSSFWDHLLPPTTALEYYAPDLHDLPVRAAALLGEAEANPARLWAATGAAEECKRLPAFLR